MITNLEKLKVCARHLYIYIYIYLVDLYCDSLDVKMPFPHYFELAEEIIEYFILFKAYSVGRELQQKTDYNQYIQKARKQEIKCKFVKLGINIQLTHINFIFTPQLNYLLKIVSMKYPTNIQIQSPWVYIYIYIYILEYLGRKRRSILA